MLYIILYYNYYTLMLYIILYYSVEWKWSPWDRIDIDRSDVTLAGIINKLIILNIFL
jgi:hypothetical protein